MNIETLRQKYIGEFTNRGSGEYILKLGLEIHPGDRILDIGASAGRFAREIETAYGQEDVVVDSLDRFGKQQVDEGVVTFSSEDGEEVIFYPNNRIVADIAEAGVEILPAEVYDKVVSFYAFPTWSGSSVETWKSLENILRSVKVDGEVRFYPVWATDAGQGFSGFDSKLHLGNILKFLKKHGYQVDFTEDEENKGAYRLVVIKGRNVVPTYDEFVEANRSGISRLVRKIFTHGS